MNIFLFKSLKKWNPSLVYLVKNESLLIRIPSKMNLFKSQSLQKLNIFNIESRWNWISFRINQKGHLFGVDGNYSAKIYHTGPFPTKLLPTRHSPIGPFPQNLYKLRFSPLRPFPTRSLPTDLYTPDLCPHALAHQNISTLDIFPMKLEPWVISDQTFFH